jgi:hypothetical protein
MEAGIRTVFFTGRGSFSQNGAPVTSFSGRTLPEPGSLTGYGALIARYGLRVPLPRRLAMIAERHHRADTGDWLILTPRHAPKDSLGGHLAFALKWEGVDLLTLSALFHDLSEREFLEVIRSTPTGAFRRRIWFLYEWLTGRRLKLPDLGKVASVPLVDLKLQCGLPHGTLSPPGRAIDSLHRFLTQGKGRLSKRARAKEFAAFTDAEVRKIEELHRSCFPD